MTDNQTESIRRKLWDEDESRSADSGESTKAMVTKWLAALVSFLLIVGVVYWVYQLGRRDANEVPVIQAMGGVARVEPVDPGGQQAAHQGLDVNEVLAGSETAPIGSQTTLAPPPQRISDTDSQTPVVVQDAEPETQTRLAGDPNMTRAVRRVVPEGLSPNSDRLSSAIAEAIALEAAGDDAQPTEQPIEINPVILVAPAPTVAPNGTIPIGSHMIQLGAYDDEASAIRDWDALVSGQRDLLTGFQRHIERREAGGRVFYRLRATGFSNLADAITLCNALLNRDVQCIALTAR